MIRQSVKDFSRAKTKVEELHLNPITQMIDAAVQAVAEARSELSEMTKAYDQMRPVWVNETNETTTIALAQLWSMLGVDNQTSAVVKLEELLK